MTRAGIGSFAAFALAAAGCAASHQQALSAPAAAPAAGETQFQSYCAACHQYDGIAGGEAPPLDGSPWVAGPESRLIKIVLHGLEGEIEIQGKPTTARCPGSERSSAMKTRRRC